VPIASRREISLPPVPAAEPAPPAAVVAAPPLPAPEAVAAPPAPAPQVAAPVVAEKPAKPEKAVKTEKAPIVASESVATAPARTEPTEELRSLALPASLEPEILTPASGGKGMKLLVAAAASIALFVALFVYPGFLRSNNKPAPVTARQDSSPLQLRVERANGELLLTWNPDAEAVRNASKAVLTIADGDQRENVAVDTAQLASGRIVYLPSGTDISFKLEVTDKSQKKTTSESVRMLRTRPSPLQEQNDAAAAKAAALAAGNKAAAPVTNPATGLNPEEQPVAEQTAKPAPTPLKPFKTESLSQRLRPAANTDMPDAPAVNAGDRSTPSAIPGVNVNAVVPAPMAPAPPAPVATDSKPKSGGNIQQAVLIYRKDAEYPKLAKQTGAKGTVVLSATIGKDGAIKAVKVISGHSMLTKAAADAVKQWRYKPTMLNGQPVEAETQVLVNFVGDR
jgi:TonB family protein